MAFTGSNVASDAMAGKSVLLYMATDGTEENPTWTLIGGQRSGDLNQEADEIDATCISSLNDDRLQAYHTSA